MKRILLAGITMLSSLYTMAQTDTTGAGSKEDTVRVGNFIIIKNKLCKIENLLFLTSTQNNKFIS